MRRCALEAPGLGTLQVEGSKPQFYVFRDGLRSSLSAIPSTSVKEENELYLTSQCGRCC